MKTLFFILSFFFFNCNTKTDGKLNNSPENNNSVQPKEHSEIISDNLSKYLPESKVGDTIIIHNFLVISYSRALKNPEWAVYKLDKERVLSHTNARRRNFEPDPALSSGTASSWDYSESGYDRGHIVPAEDMDFSEQAMQESFYMSNVSPQLPGYNRGIWKKLENTVRKNASKNGDLIIISGTVFTDGELTEISNGVAVPSFFYKIILREDNQKKSAIAFVIPHSESHSNLGEFAMSVSEAEKICGLNFFKQYGTSTDFESVFNKEDWIIY
jgi:endonuclease G